jgi:hypothetical protein
MNYKLCIRKWSWSNFKVLPRHLLGGTEKDHKNLVKIASIQAEILTRDVQNTKQLC